MKYYFIGLSGGGKSTIAKALAEDIGMTFIDTDEIIEDRESMSIEQIFKEKGEEYFRGIETLVLKEIDSINTDVVVSLGGGIILKEDNRKIIKRDSIVIEITRDFNKIETIDRPLYKKYTPLQLYNSRKNIYDALSDYKVHNNSNIEDVVREIRELILK